MEYDKLVGTITEMKKELEQQKNGQKDLQELSEKQIKKLSQQFLQLNEKYTNLLKLLNAKYTEAISDRFSQEDDCIESLESCLQEITEKIEKQGGSTAIIAADTALIRERIKSMENRLEQLSKNSNDQLEERVIKLEIAQDESQIDEAIKKIKPLTKFANRKQ